MAKFLKGNGLNAELESLFDTAKNSIILISPYIKLHDRYIASLQRRIQDHNLKITVLFGKNEDDISKSMKKEDFDFFKQFPNIEILYEKRLHAKYYANDSKAILTSMNLYGFSQNNNIEAGVLMEKSSMAAFTGNKGIDDDTSQYFADVVTQADLLFEKKPDYTTNMLGIKKYVQSKITTDKLTEFFSGKDYKKVFNKTSPIPKHETKNTNNGIGYCIRTGREIPFNVKNPMDYNAYKMWSKYKDPNFPEKYCHFSGEPSNGETSMNKPILSKYWKEAKAKFDF